MHHIQKKILDKLIYADGLRYSQLKPMGIESNHFSYHLKCLMRDGYVDKQDKIYRLSAAGKAHVDRVSYETLNIREQPKIITLLVITNNKGQTALYKRRHQPYFGMIGFPTGKVHMGETVQEAAKREAKDKLNISDISLEHRGVAYIAISENEQLISHICAHVFTGNSQADITAASDKRAKKIWGSPSKSDNLIPGYFEVKKLLDKKEFFFANFEFTL